MPKTMFTSLLTPHTKVTGEQLATEEGLRDLELNIRALNRRRFLGTMAAASALAAVGGALSGPQAEAQAAATPSIVDILNFSLNLEFLEAEFYSYGINGKSLADNVTASTNPASGATATIAANLPTVTANTISNPPQVTLTGNQLAVVQALLQDESHHIALLQSTINANGGTPVTSATIDYSAAGTIPPITTAAAYFAAARQFTAVGNSAYAGAAASLVSVPNILQTAGQILGAEAQHLGVINYLCALLGVTPAQDPQVDAQDVPPNGTAQIFTVTPIPNPITQTSAPAAVGIARTPQQVLGIVYGISKPTTLNPQAGVTRGGFFPGGVSGNIVST